MNDNKRTAWALLADAAGARLIECGRTPGGSCHVEIKDTLRATPRARGRGRPIMTRGDGHTASGETHEGEEDMRRFAHELTRWIQQKALEYHIEGLVVFAPPRFLGAIRQTPLEQIGRDVREVHGELSSMDESELARQPAIQSLVLTGHGGVVDQLSAGALPR